MMLTLVRQPFELHSTLFSGQAFRWRLNGAWSEGVVFENFVRLRQSDKGIEFTSAPGDEGSLEPWLRDYLGLNHDMEHVYESIALDDRLKTAINNYPGMRILRQDPWECLISFLLAQASNIPRITRNIEDICQAFGRPIKIEARTCYAFPNPGDLVNAGVQELKRLKLGYRAEYIYSAALAVEKGDLDLLALRGHTYEGALETLMLLNGVGDKVANCILLFSLDKPEAFPVDVWIERALQEWYLDPREQKLSRQKMRLWASSHFGPYAGYANHYLFHDRRQQGKTNG